MEYEKCFCLMEELVSRLLSITQLEPLTKYSFADEMKRINEAFLRDPNLRKNVGDIVPFIEVGLFQIRQQWIQVKNENRSLESHEVACFFRLAELIRNVVAQNPHNQALVSETRILDHVFEIMESLEPLPSVTLDTAFRMGIQMFSNLVTENPVIQGRLWPRLVDSSIFLVGLSSKEPKTTRSTLIAMYNSVHANSDHALVLFGSKIAPDVVRGLIALCDRFVDNEKDIDFELSVALLTSGLELDLFPKFWSFCELDEQRIALLKLLDGYAHTGKSLIGNDTCLEMLTILKECEEEFVLEEGVSRQVYYTIQFWCSISNQFHSGAMKWFEQRIHEALIGKTKLIRFTV
jgi:hypothetical protein